MNLRFNSSYVEPRSSPLQQPKGTVIFDKLMYKFKSSERNQLTPTNHVKFD